MTLGQQERRGPRRPRQDTKGQGIDCLLRPSEMLSVVVIEPRGSRPTRHREGGTSEGLLIKSHPLHALSTDMSTQLRNTRPNRTPLDLTWRFQPSSFGPPGPTSTALDPTISRHLAVKKFVGSSPIASTKFPDQRLNSPTGTPLCNSSPRYPRATPRPIVLPNCRAATSGGTSSVPVEPPDVRDPSRPQRRAGHRDTGAHICEGRSPDRGPMQPLQRTPARLAVP